MKRPYPPKKYFNTTRQESKNMIFPTGRNLFFYIILLLAFRLVFTASNNNLVSIQGNCSHKYIRNQYCENFSGIWGHAILQDKRGIIYIGGNDGLWQFDGISRRLIPIPNHYVLSIVCDAKGNIYIGGKNEIGYIAPDSKGVLQFKSLVRYLKKNHKHFDVLRTHATEEGIYFNTGNFLFRWNTNLKKIKVWKPSRKFLLSFTCGKKLFIQDSGIGIKKIQNNTLQLIQGKKKFAEEKVIFMTTYNSKILIGTRKNRLYLYDDTQSTPFSIQAKKFLEKKGLSHAIQLSDGDLAIATFLGGLVIIDAQGSIKQTFNKSYGLLDNLIKQIFQDIQGNLWLIQEMGISKIEYSSSISIYDDRSDLSGKVLTVTRHHNKLYAGTESGLYFLSPGGKFQPVPGISAACHSLLSFDEFLLAATNTGVLQVGKKYIAKIINTPAHLLVKSQNKHIAWVGTPQGLFILYKENHRWTKKHLLKTFLEYIYNIVEDRKGNLWILGNWVKHRNGNILKKKEVIKIHLPIDQNMINTEGIHYDSSHGLPSMNVQIFEAGGHLIFSTDKGIYRINEKNGIFIPDHKFENELLSIINKKVIHHLVEDKNQNVWFGFNANRLIQGKIQSDGALVIRPIIYSLRFPTANVNQIYPEPSGNILWIARDDGLIRYNIETKMKNLPGFSTLIRKVLASGNLIFGGNPVPGEKNSESKQSCTRIPYKKRSLSFEFSTPFFLNETMTTYRSLLEGYDDDWTNWNRETKREYSNLKPGLYRFYVQAKNVYGQLGHKDVFQFRILQPWYRTWWAIFAYGLMISIFTYLVIKWQRALKLEKEKQKLEQIVKERTIEIKRKNQQLIEQSEKLKEIDQQKSRFFANISHEFRTPLTLIMGPLQQMLSPGNAKDKNIQKPLKLMLQNSRRLLSLINQLLELAKFESDKVHLRISQQNIVRFVKGIASSFEPATAQNKLELIFHCEEENIPFYFDPEKLEKVIFNLLSNAVKFTPTGGKITIAVSRKNTKETNFPLGWLEISICDTGPGIPRNQLPHIFDRFYQSDITWAHHHEGSGIGLAIAKELVELHQGKICVNSSVGKNSKTEFLIRLPTGNDHIKPGEIVAPREIPLRQMPHNNSSAISKIAKDINELSGTKETLLESPSETANRDRKDTKQMRGKSTHLKSSKNIILIVEDNIDFREFIRGALETLYMVIEAENGREGIYKAQEIIPDLIICDIMMPGPDGYELCREIKNNIKTSHIPIILLTAKASEKSIIRGLERGADDYITKPFNSRILLARIKNLIDLRCQLQLTRRQQIAIQPINIPISSMDEIFFKELQEMIEKNLSDSKFNVEQLAKKLFMSRPTLYRKIIALTGESPNQFIRSYRLKRAAQLLKANFGNVTEVALEVGFTNIGYFSQCFKEKFHLSPSVYQASKPHL